MVAGGVSVSALRSKEFWPIRTEWAFFILGAIFRVCSPMNLENFRKRFYGEFYWAMARERKWR
jgi:hypothetical protein